MREVFNIAQLNVCVKFKKWKGKKMAEASYTGREIDAAVLSVDCRYIGDKNQFWHGLLSSGTLCRGKARDGNMICVVRFTSHRFMFIDSEH